MPRPTPPGERRKRRGAVALLLAAFAIAVFLPAAGHRFIEQFDDALYVSRNPAMRLPAPEALRWAFASAGYVANWHPLTWLSHRADVGLFGFDPGRHHLANVLWHGANAALLFLVLRGFTGAALPSAFAAALFAVHPLRVESVAWIAERKDLLCGFFWLLTMGAHLRYARRPAPGRYLLVALGLGLALLAKPMAVTLPLALLVLDVWPLGRWMPRRSLAPGARPGPSGHAGRAALLEKVPLLILAAAAGLVTVLAQREGGAVRPLATHPLGERLANAVLSAAAYLGTTLWPRDLAFFYPFPAAPAPWWRVAGAVAVLAAITALALRRVRARPWLLCGWLWYLLTVAPVIGIVQVGEQARADRYTYLPSVGLLLVLVWTGAEALRGGSRRVRAAGVVLAAAVLVPLALASRRQLAFWRDDLTLAARALEVTRANHRAHLNLADALARSGRGEEAAGHYEEALRIRPSYPPAHYGLANLLRERGRFEEALARYREALAGDPGFLEAHTNLGNLLASLGRTAEAERTYREALALGIGCGDVCNNLGHLLLRNGRTEEARDLLRRAVREQPWDGNSHFNLAAAQERLGNRSEAAAHYEAALRVNPADRQARAGLARTSRPAGRE